jgi:FKBP-type peptidyl-prolyl cis-trans isomerase
MTRTLALLLLCVLPAGAFAATAAGVAPKTEDDKTLFAIGQILSGSVKNFALSTHEMQLVEAGFAEGMRGGKPSVDADAYRPKIQALLNARTEQQVAKTKAAGKAYRDKAAAAKDTTTTPSGVIMTMVKTGTGAVPTADDQVKVHYEGKLVDGTVFDSSIQRGQPLTFKVTGVVPCWSEALQHMHAGSKIKLVCPPDLAYGDRGSPPKIPGGATLVFDVELLDVIKAEAPATSAAPGSPAAPAEPAGTAAPKSPATAPQ